MNFKLTTIVLTLLTIWTLSINAQNSSDYLPENPTFVLKVNPNVIETKVDLDKLLEMDFFESFLASTSADINYDNQESIADALENPSKYGIDMRSSSYFVGEMSDVGSFFTYVFKLSDEQKFAQFYEDNIKTDSFVQQEIGDFQNIEMNNSYLSWNKDVVMMTNGTVKYDYTEYTDEEFIEAELVQATTLKNYVQDLIKNSPTQNQYFLAQSDNSDMYMWLDYGYLSTMGEGMGGDLMDDIPVLLQGFVEGFQSMNEDTYVAMAMNFDKGAINIDSKTHMNDDMLQVWKGAVDMNINKKFGKYIKGNNLLGLLSFAYSIENTAKGFKNMLYNKVEKSSDMGGVATSMMDIFAIAIDEEALYNLFKGDMVFAITGMRNYEREVTVYEYDADFNRVEVQRMSTETLPEFTMMMSYGNEKDVRKLIRLGEKATLIQHNGKYYTIAIPDMSMEFYIALHKGILFFTNDRDLIINNLSRGYSRQKRMSKAQCKMLKENSRVFQWNIPETMDVVGNLGMALGFEGDQMMNMTKNTFENITMTSSKIVGNTVNSTISLNLANKEINALEELFNYFNNLYITEMGGRKM